MALADRPHWARRSDRLRRLDWRFLLPVDPSRCIEDAAFIGADPELLETVAEVGLAERPRLGLPASPDSVDLVAVLGGVRADVRRIADALRPSGLVYWEVDRRRTPRVTPRRLEETFRAAGLQPLGGHAIRPRLDAPELYLPLQSTAAGHWFVDSVYTPSRPAQRIVEWTSRALMHRPDAFAAAAPFHVAVAQKPPVCGTTMSAHIAAQVDGTPTAPPAMLNHSGTRVVFAFCDPAARPVLVAKVPKLPALVDRTRREQQMLGCLHASVDTETVAGAPKPLGTATVNRSFVAWETGQAGTSMAKSSGGWGAGTSARLDDLHAAARWITRLHREHRFGVRAWDGRTVDEVLCCPIESYTRLFGVTDAERFLFRRVTARAVEFDGSLPVVWEHGDYTVWNVFRRRPEAAGAGDVAVVDWEGSGPGLPYVDLFRFAVHWTEFASPGARRLGRRALLARTLFGDAGRVGSAVRATLDAYLDAIEIDRSIEPVLVTRLYVELAVRRHHIALESGRSPDRPRMSNPAIDMVGHLASFADRW